MSIFRKKFNSVIVIMVALALVFSTSILMLNRVYSASAQSISEAQAKVHTVEMLSGDNPVYAFSLELVGTNQVYLVFYSSHMNDTIYEIYHKVDDSFRFFVDMAIGVQGIGARVNLSHSFFADGLNTVSVYSLYTQAQWSFYYMPYAVADNQISNVRFNALGQLMWNHPYWNFNVALNRHLSAGFEHIRQVQSSISGQVRLQDLDLKTGDYSIRISRSTGQFALNNNTLYSKQEIYVWNFYVGPHSEQQAAYDFTIENDTDGPQLRFGGMNGAVYTIYVNGSRLRHNRGGALPMRLAELGLMPGDNMVRVVSGLQAAYASGVLDVSVRVAEWNIFVVENYTIVPAAFNVSSHAFGWAAQNNRWRAHYNVMRYDSDSGSYVFVGSTFGTNSILFEWINAAVGYNTLRATEISNAIYTGGTLTLDVLRAHWTFEYIERDEYIDYDFELDRHGLTFNGALVNYNAYLDRHDGKGFNRIRGSFGGGRISDLYFEDGATRTVRVQSMHLRNYQNGVIYSGSRIGYFSFEIAFKDYVRPRTWRTQLTDSFWWYPRYATTTYQIYIDRHDGNGFVFSMGLSSANRFTQLQPSVGENTVKVVGYIDDSFYGDVLTLSRSIGYWNFTHTVGQQVVTREIYLVDSFWGNDQFRWGGVQNVTYTLYVDRHDGNGFVYIQTIRLTSVLTTRNIAILGLTSGANTVRIIASNSAWAGLWTYYAGEVNSGTSVSYTSIELTHNNFYITTDFNVSHTNNGVNWDANWHTDYRLYLACDNTKDFIYIKTVQRDFGFWEIDLSHYLRYGSNVLRIVEAKQASITLQHGVLNIGYSARVGYREIYVMSSDNGSSETTTSPDTDNQTTIPPDIGDETTTPDYSDDNGGSGTVDGGEVDDNTGGCRAAVSASGSVWFSILIIAGVLVALMLARKKLLDDKE